MISSNTSELLVCDLSDLYMKYLEAINNASYEITGYFSDDRDSGIYYLKGTYRDKNFFFYIAMHKNITILDRCVRHGDGSMKLQGNIDYGFGQKLAQIMFSACHILPEYILDECVRHYIPGDSKIYLSLFDLFEVMRASGTTFDVFDEIIENHELNQVFRYDRHNGVEIINKALPGKLINYLFKQNYPFKCNDAYNYLIEHGRPQNSVIEFLKMYAPVLPSFKHNISTK